MERFRIPPLCSEGVYAHTGGQDFAATIRRTAARRFPRTSMGRSPTQSDVALRAGVSTATVSRVLNNPESVRPRVRAWVEKVISDLDYFPHGAARALASNRSRTIGAVFPTVNNEIFAAAINALEESLFSAGYTLVLSVSKYSLETEATQVRRLVERGIDGLVLVGNDHAAETYALIDQARLPFVSLLSYDPNSSRSNIGILNRDGGRAAVEHLISLGHSRIGMICGLTAENDRARGRYQGFTDALADQGLRPFRDAVVEKPYTIEAGREALRELLDGDRLPDALVCGNDVLALGVLLEAQSRGLDVPRDLSIVGFDDLPLARHFRPALTTIAVPVEAAGRHAGTSLVAAIAASGPVVSLCLEAPLLVRASTAPPRVIANEDTRRSRKAASGPRTQQATR
jgi:LacI family transcriptional regulator